MAIRKMIEEKQSHRKRCAMNPLESCQGADCMGWMQETKDEPSKDRSFDVVKVPTDFGYCGMVRG